MEGGAYTQDKLNIRANAPSSLLPQGSVEKEGGRIFRSLGKCVNAHDIWCCEHDSQLVTNWPLTITLYQYHQLRIAP